MRLVVFVSLLLFNVLLWQNVSMDGDFLFIFFEYFAIMRIFVK